MITIVFDYPVILSFFLCIFYKAVNNLVVSIDNEALPVPRQLMRSTRSASSNAITSIPKQSRTVTDQRSFFISAWRTWNILPTELCTSYISLASFKHSLHYFNITTIRILICMTLTTSEPGEKSLLGAT